MVRRDGRAYPGRLWALSRAPHGVALSLGTVAERTHRDLRTRTAGAATGLGISAKGSDGRRDRGRCFGEIAADAAEAGFTVITGDARAPQFLNRAAARRAKQVIAVCDD
jgi:voltage-gated potassium channel Kch